MSKRPKNPKSLRTAIKYGWTPVKVKGRDNMSWMAVCIAVDGMIKGRSVQRHGTINDGTMAFELAQDAVMVSLRFG